MQMADKASFLATLMSSLSLSYAPLRALRVYARCRIRYQHGGQGLQNDNYSKMKVSLRFARAAKAANLLEKMVYGSMS
jgi:hypothetical protein